MGILKVALGSALVVLAGLSIADTANDAPLIVDQGWSIADKTQWHSLSQGSRLIPRAWLTALEQADVDRPFLQRSHIDSFRYLIDPLPLPVGFVVDVQSDRKFSEVTRLRWKKGQSDREPWVGMNCAACHTAELTFQGNRMRVEGAPALGDFQGFMKAMNGALTATLQDQKKWHRFAGQVLAGTDDAGNRKLLKDALGSLVRWQQLVEQTNHTDLQYGFARVDAFGHIYNKVRLAARGMDQPRNPSDAPVSYPFLWNTSQHDVVQWNGMAANNVIAGIDIGALGRNVGEATGVFADLTLTAPGVNTTRNGYQTSADVKNLFLLEKLVSKLKPPVWPDALPPIDADKWDAGRLLFNQPNACASCHEVLGRDDLSKRITVNLTPLFGSFFNWKKPLSLTEKAAAKHLWEAGADNDARLQRCMNEKDKSRLAYKGRPLTGIWATAPFLHNGSVPTLYDLLLPPELRPRSFKLGTREFDPDKVGFVTDAARAPYLTDRARLENTFTFDTRDGAGLLIAGNSNLGHDYGNATFTEDQRQALVEYMKAIGARRVGNTIVP